MSSAAAAAATVSNSPGLLKVVAESLTKAAKATGKKAQETCAYLRAPPSQVECKSCRNPVIVPPQIFQWTCPACTLQNAGGVSRCAACNTPQQEQRYVVECTVCHAQVDVPSSNAKKGLINAKETSIKLATKAKEAAKEKYEYLKAQPEHFNCEHCNTLLYNPNFSSSNGEQGESKQEQQASLVTQLICPTCHKITQTPHSNFKNALISGKATTTRTATRVYCSLAGKPCVDCPVCANPVIVQPQMNSVTPNPTQTQTQTQVPATATPPASAPLPAQAVSAAASVQSRVELLCKKCNTVFPTVLQVQ